MINTQPQEKQNLSEQKSTDLEYTQNPAILTIIEEIKTNTTRRRHTTTQLNSEEVNIKSQIDFTPQRNKSIFNTPVKEINSETEDDDIEDENKTSKYKIKSAVSQIDQNFSNKAVHDFGIQPIQKNIEEFETKLEQKINQREFENKFDYLINSVKKQEQEKKQYKELQEQLVDNLVEKLHLKKNDPVFNQDNFVNSYEIKAEYQTPIRQDSKQSDPLKEFDCKFTDSQDIESYQKKMFNTIEHQYPKDLTNSGQNYIQSPTRKYSNDQNDNQQITENKQKIQIQNKPQNSYIDQKRQFENSIGDMKSCMTSQSIEQKDNFNSSQPSLLKKNSFMAIPDEQFSFNTNQLPQKQEYHQQECNLLKEDPTAKYVDQKQLYRPPLIKKNSYMAIPDEQFSFNNNKNDCPFEREHSLGTMKKCSNDIVQENPTLTQIQQTYIPSLIKKETIIDVSDEKFNFDINQKYKEDFNTKSQENNERKSSIQGENSPVQQQINEKKDSKLGLEQQKFNEKYIQNLIKNEPQEGFPDDVDINRFELGDFLGSGDKQTDKIYALKFIKKQMLIQENCVAQLSREIINNYNCDHPNIQKLYDFFDDEQKVVLVMELAEQGDIYKQLKKQQNQKYSEQIVSQYCLQLANALQYMHQKQILHRDIKPENILQSQGKIKLADFGWSINSRGAMRNSFCGTLDYVAPEVVQGEDYGTSIDIWGLAVLCFELCAGFPPFESPLKTDTYLNILSVKYEFPEYFSAELQDLLSKIFIANTNQRIDLEEILQHSWIKKYN